VRLSDPFAPGSPSPDRPLSLRRSKKGPARLAFTAKAQAATARPAGPISDVGRGAHIAKNHNARAERDAPLLVHAGLVPLMSWQEGTARGREIMDAADRSDRERREGEEALFARYFAELVAVDPDAAAVIAAWARWKLPVLIGALLLRKASRLLRAGREVPQLVDARYWLPHAVGGRTAGLTYWTGDRVIFGDSGDAEARAACSAAFAEAVEFIESCAPLPPEEPLRKSYGRWGLPRRHRVAMRHLRDRSPLP
jgi:hypothetical protein